MIIPVPPMMMDSSSPSSHFQPYAFPNYPGSPAATIYNRFKRDHASPYDYDYDDNGDEVHTTLRGYNDGQVRVRDMDKDMETELVVIMEMEMENTTMAKKEEDTTITTTTVIHMMSLNPK